MRPGTSIHHQGRIDILSAAPYDILSCIDVPCVIEFFAFLKY